MEGERGSSPTFIVPSSSSADSASPLSPMSQQSKRAKSAALDPNLREVYGLNLGLLRRWQSEKNEALLSSEVAMQEIAVAKVRGFLDAIGCVVKIQSWWRMMEPFHKHMAMKRAQRKTKYTFFRALRLYWKTERLFRVQMFGKFFIGWRDETRTAKKLKLMVTAFFKICIQRLRLTPQACMAFFNPGEWSSAIAKEDMLKIRRLMLEKLFFGWRTETRDLRMVRYKASQILSRMVRRTKGPLWVKEATLVCFHMWFRYIQVKKAYRLDLPDPRYTNPMLPQWTKLMKDITVNRIKRKRTGELGAHLTRLRAFKGWKRLMSVDRTKPVTPLAVAIMHYSTVLLTKVLHEWHSVIRERGKIMRFRNKLFQVWRQWAPKHKRMRNFNDQAEELIRLKLVQRAYGVMIKLCFNVIGTRTEKIKELRRNFCDRRVVICAYALLHKDSHVMMVDCWRRLYFYWKSRRNWKSVAWHYTYEWHAHKMKVIFLAWKSLTKPTQGTPQMLLTRSAKNKSGNTSSSLLYVTETEDESDTDEPTPIGQMSRGSSVESMSTLNSDDPNSTIGPLLGRTAGQTPHSHTGANSSTATSATGSEAGSRPITPPPGEHSRRRQSSLRFKMNFSNPYSGGTGKSAVNKTPNYEKLVRGFVPKALGIVQKGVEGRLSTKLSSLQFRTFCYALSRSYAQLANKLHQCLVSAGQPTLQTSSVVTDAGAGSALGNIDENGDGQSAAHSAVSDPAAANSTTYSRRPTPQQLHSSGASIASESTMAVVGHTERADYDVNVSHELHFPVQLYFNRSLQERLQTAIDQVDMEEVLRVVSEGAVIETHHMRQIGLHIGDMYMPLFTLLLTNSAQFFADRVTKQDAQVFLMDIQNPISAFLMGSQIERWNRGELTYREMMQVTQDLPTQRYISGEFSSYYLMRLIILKNIDMKSKQLLNLCVMLPEERTVDQEVPEVLKRQKLAKLYRLRKSLTEMIGGDDTFQETYLAAMNSIPPLVKPRGRPATTPYGDHGNTAGKDIYTVLREFTLLTGKLTLEAKSIRAPLMERDQRLIDNGFLRQARADFLALRESCLTDKQKAAIAEKQQKAAEKERKAAEKLKKAERKKREKRTSSAGGKRKGKKGKHGTEEINFDDIDAEALTSDDEGYQSENGDERQLSELCKLNFLLEGGLDIGEEVDVHQAADFQQRTAHFRHPVYLEVWSRAGWRDRAPVREAIQRTMIAFMRGSIRRVVDVLQADKTIGKINYASARQVYKGIGPWLVNHVLANVSCRRSATWYVLPKDYWSFRIVRERVNLELAMTDATLSGIKGRVGQNHSETYHIANDISSYQKFLKTARKEILKIAEKRASKSDADAAERAPYMANIKKTDVKIRGAEKAIEEIREKLRRADVQVATGNLNGAAEVFIPPEEPPVETKPGKKNKKNESEKAVIQYDFKAVYALMDAANQEIQRLQDVIAEQNTKKKESENVMRMYDWQCQKTSRMLRDLAENRFQVMVDVQAIAVREAKHLESTEDMVATHTSRYKAMKRYHRQLMDFLEGPIADRSAQLSREAEQRRVSEILNRTPSNRTDFSSPADAKAAAEKAASKKRGMLSASGEEVSPLPSFRSALGSRASSEQDFFDRSMTIPLDTLGGSNIDEDGSVADSTFSFEDSSHKEVMKDRLRHEQRNAVPVVDDAHEVDPAAQDNRTSSQIAVDAEIELAHHNSLENRLKREEALKLLAEEQAREMATQDLRLRVFDDYWTALPQNAERVQRRRSNEAKAQVNVDESSTVATSVTEVSAEYLSRTQKIWKSIGTQYWRTKEEFVRSALQSGKDTDNIHAAFRTVDPLDEDLNDLPVVPRFTDEDAGQDQAAGSAYTHLVAAFDQVGHDFWKSTAQPDHAMMVSVSIKELLMHGEAESIASGARRGDSHSTLSRNPSDSSLNALHPPLSRQASHEVPDAHAHAAHATHATTPAHGHHHAPPLIRGGGRAGPKPDPFSLIAKDEHARYVDHRIHYEPEQPILPFGSFDTQQEQERLHAELGALAHHFLPPVLEGERFSVDRDLEHSLEDEEVDEDSIGSSTVSSSFRYPRGHKMREYLLSLGVDTTASERRIPPSPGEGETQTSTFEKFDRMFDRINDTICGALEDALSNEPSLSGAAEGVVEGAGERAAEVTAEGEAVAPTDEQQDAAPGTATEGEAAATTDDTAAELIQEVELVDSKLRTDGTVVPARKNSFEEADVSVKEVAKPEPRMADLVKVQDLGDLAARLARKGSPADKSRPSSTPKTPVESKSVKFSEKPDVSGKAGSQKAPSAPRATISSPSASKKEERKASISAAVPGAAGGFSASAKSPGAGTITGAGSSIKAPVGTLSDKVGAVARKTISAAAAGATSSPSGRAVASPKGGRPSSAQLKTGPARPSSAQNNAAQVPVSVPAPVVVATVAATAVSPERKPSLVKASPAKTPVSSESATAQHKGTPPQPAFTDTLTSATHAAIVEIPQPQLLHDKSGVSATSGGSAASSPQRTLESPPKLDIRPKMVFSDDLLPSSREVLLEDDVTSELSMEQFTDEHGEMFRGEGAYAGNAHHPFRHPDLDRVRRQSQPGADANSPNSWSDSPLSQSPRNAGSGSVGSGSGGSHPSRPRLKRGDTFDESVGKLRESMSLSVDVEPPYEGPGEPERYLPEREMREALFGADLDMGAAGLASFLQSFATPELPADSSKKRPKKITIEEDKGSVATKVNGEWVLLPSPLGAKSRPYSPKIGPFSPKAPAAAKPSTFGSNISPGNALAILTNEPEKEFVLMGTTLTPAKDAVDDVLQMKVPALSPNDQRRLAQKLGLDMQQQQSLQQAANSGVTVDPTAPVSEDLLSLVKEFYLEKAQEEQKLERLKEKSAVSYYPANFRQHKDRMKEEIKTSQGDLRSLLANAGLFDEDSNSENDEGEHSAEDEFMMLLQHHQDISGHMSSGPDTPHAMMHHNNTMRGSFVKSLGSGEPSPDHRSTKVRRGSTKAIDTIHYSSNDILAAVAAVAGAHGANHHGTAGHAAGQGTDAVKSGKEGGTTPSRRLSVKMERMLSRRSSYNPAEIRLELLNSIHDSEEEHNLDLQVDTAVQEVKKYLHEREVERHAVVPTGKLRTKESFARSYRDAIQNRANPYKSLAVQRSHQQLAEQEALLQQASQRRPSPPSSPKSSAKHVHQQIQQQHQQAPEAASAAISQQGILQDKHETLESVATHSQRHFFPEPQHSAHVKMPHYSVADASSGDGFVEDPQFAYVVKRAGTPEFWVDVAKIVSPTAAAAAAALAEHRGDGIAQSALGQEEDPPDDLSAVSGGEVRRIGGRNGGQMFVLHDSGPNYQEAVVSGFGDDRPGVHHTGTLHRGSAVHPNRSTELHEELNLDVVKLQHPVSRLVDPKTEGQYNLYRERSPLRSSRRSTSPPANRSTARSSTNTSEANAALEHATARSNPGAGKKNLAYSHSDGQLLGANMMLTSKKAKLNVPGTTSKVPQQQQPGTDENTAADDHTTGGDTVLSVLSPMFFNLPVKPFSPPPLSGPAFFSTSTVESSSGSVGAQPRTPGGAVTNTLSPGTPQGSRPTSRMRSYSKDIEISNPNSRPSTPGDAGSHTYPAVLVLPTTPSLRNMKSDDAPDAFLSTDMSARARDYRSSASAARIISEIAGETYYTGTGNTSVAGTVVADNVPPTDTMWYPAASVVGGILPDEPSVIFTGGNLEAASSSIVKLTEQNFPTSPSSQSSKRVAPITNFMFSPDSLVIADSPSPQRPYSRVSTAPNMSSKPNSPTHTLRSQGSFSFNLQEDSESVVAPLKFPAVSVSSKQYAKSSASAKNTKSDVIPSNIVVAGYRNTDTAPLDGMIITPQVMSGLKSINVRSSAQQNTFVHPTSSSTKGGKAAKLKAISQRPALERQLSASSNLVGDAESIQSVLESSVKVPVPVNRVVVNDNSVGLGVSTGVHSRPMDYFDATPVEESGVDAEDEAAMEADIERELRQMLNQQYLDDAEEAYRRDYYERNKEHLAKAGVAMHSTETDSHAAALAANVPFNAGSNHKPSVAAGVGFTGYSTFEKMKMSSSVGGGGFTGRGHGVLHKVKGAALSASTSQLPPLDPALCLNVDPAFSMSAGHALMPGKPGKSKRPGADILLTDQESLIQNRLVLQSLLHNAMGGSAETMPVYNPLVSSSAKLARQSGSSKKNRFSAPASSAQVRNSLNMVDIASSVLSEKSAASAQNQLNQLSLCSNQSAPLANVNASPMLTASRRGSGVESLNSIGSLPLQSIHAPAVEISHGNPKGNKAMKGGALRKAK